MKYLIKILNMQLQILFILFILFLSVVNPVLFAQPSLKETFKHYYIGTALNNDQVFGRDKKSIALVEEHFNSITPENLLKWEKVHPKNGEYNFEPVDSLVALGEKNNMFIVGHTLIWHSQTPAWVFEDESGNELNREQLLARMKDHILTVVGRYKGKIHGWDVVNEGVKEDGSLRETKWLKIIGGDYIDKAFEFAHEADPEAELYYNDFNMWYKGKLLGVTELVKNLRTKSIKIDGIGLQGHWGLDYPTNSEINLALETYSELNLKLMITELDMAVLPMPDNNTGAEITNNFELQKKYNPFPNGFPDSMQTKLANRYEDFFKLFNKYKNSISRVTFWGVNDEHSWRNNWPIRGRTSYPMLFDRNFETKPAFYKVINTVKGEK